MSRLVQSWKRLRALMASMDAPPPPAAGGEVRLAAARVLVGECSEREFVAWTHTHVDHSGREDLQDLVELDVEYAGDDLPDDVRSSVRERALTLAGPQNPREPWTPDNGADGDPFDFMMRWYHAQCDEDWEHGYGVKLESLDNPGWSIRIDLIGTLLEGVLLPTSEINRTDDDWVHTWSHGVAFEGVCGVSNLIEMLAAFRLFALAGGPERGTDTQGGLR